MPWGEPRRASTEAYGDGRADDDLLALFSAPDPDPDDPEIAAFRTAIEKIARTVRNLGREGFGTFSDPADDVPRRVALAVVGDLSELAARVPPPIEMHVSEPWRDIACAPAFLTEARDDVVTWFLWCVVTDEIPRIAASVARAFVRNSAVSPTAGEDRAPGVGEG